MLAWAELFLYICLGLFCFGSFFFSLIHVSFFQHWTWTWKLWTFPMVGMDVQIPSQSCPKNNVSHCRVQLFGIPWAIACQAPLSMEFFRQEYWSELPFPSPGVEPESPTLQADSLPSEQPGKQSCPRFPNHRETTKFCVGSWRKNWLWVQVLVCTNHLVSLHYRVGLHKTMTAIV